MRIRLVEPDFLDGRAERTSYESLNTSAPSGPVYRAKARVPPSQSRLLNIPIATTPGSQPNGTTSGPDGNLWRCGVFPAQTLLDARNYFSQRFLKSRFIASRDQRQQVVAGEAAGCGCDHGDSGC
jgi:hypothetical protein